MNGDDVNADGLEPGDYVEAVLSLVEQIPVGSVSTYGNLAEMVGQGGPRGVGRVMATHGAAVPWWRVIRADGRPVVGLENEAMQRLREEGAPLRGERVDLTRARWSGPPTH
ncbi:MAG: MGMT family protein [Propionibacteriaceae bacterium]